MFYPIYDCESISDLEAPIDYLVDCIKNDSIFPVCKIGGSLIENVSEFDDNYTEEKSGEFTVIKVTISTELERIVSALSRVSLFGFEDMFTDEDLQFNVLNTRSTPPHRDNGHSNIVNLTLSGSRFTTVYAQDGEEKTTQLLQKGCISVIPAQISKGSYLNCPSHKVESKTEGHILNIQHYRRAYNYDAMSPPA